MLSVLVEKLEETTLFNGANIYIDEFSGFTAQEYEVIRVLLRKSKQVTITICAENLDTVSNEDIFYSNCVTSSKLMKIASEENVEIEPIINLSKAYRFKNIELKHLEQNLYTYPSKSYLNQVEHLHLFLAANPYSEIEKVAQQINTLVQEKKYRYRDIAIITKSQDEYASLIKAIFAVRKIPIFIDEKKDLSENIFVKFLLSVLEIFAKGWNTQNVFASIKTGFFDISKEESFKLENYCNRFGIRGKAWYEKDWEYVDKCKDETDKLNEIRRKIIEPLRDFQNGLANGKTVKEMTEKLYQFLEHMQVEEKINQKIHVILNDGKVDVAEEYAQSTQIVTKTLDQIVELFGEDTISFEKYLELLKIGFRVDMLGKIPATLDQVTLGDVERSRSHKVKAVFIIGVNDRSISKCAKRRGLFK